MNDLPQPSSLLDPKDLEIIRNESAKAEKEKRLTKPVLALIHDRKWFKLLAPTRYGGLQMAVPEVLQMEEALAWADGSLGWSVTLCAGAGWFGGFFNDELSKKIFTGDKACIAGSGATTGTAEETKDGYIVNGTWPHASGSPDASAFTANCIITKDKKPSKDESGRDTVLSFIFLKDEVTMLPTWNAMGMVASASHGYEVKNLLVSAERAFNINGSDSKFDSALYSYPFLQLAEATLSVNISGMAIHFTDLCSEIFAAKKNRQGIPLAEDVTVQDIFEKQKHKLHDARTKLYYAVALSWQASTNSRQIKEAILYKVSAAAYELSKRARECVDALYPFCGLTAADKSSEINRVWRDLHTASQHSLLVFGGLPE